jgi:DNA-binding NtrC family response regulator
MGRPAITLDFLRGNDDSFHLKMNSTFSLLLVDDDRLIADSLRLLLKKSPWTLTVVTNEASVPTEGSFHAAFVDLHLTPDTSKAEGTGVMAGLKERFPRTEIIAISGDLSLELMEKCLAHGAKKFLAKPLMPDEVMATLEKVEALWRLREIEHRPSPDRAQWIGRSKTSDHLKSQIAQLVGEKGPILIEGETGTGKEVVSRLLHQQDPARPFIPVNISAIPETLFESELFGHVKGAFTGADQMKVGLAEAANGGDLFLDEIEALPLAQQVKLLRFLESGEVRKVGGKETTRPHVRVVAASNQNLETLAKEGKFREDLLFRLKAKKLLLPPLRDRLDDLEDLAKYFLAHERPRSNKMFTADAFALLKTYRWPGNVRELKRVCEQLALTSPLPMIRPEDVQKILFVDGDSSGAAKTAFNLKDGKGLQEKLDAFEAELIQFALNEIRDIDRTTETLKMSRSGLYKKIKDYGLEVPS